MTDPISADLFTAGYLAAADLVADEQVNGPDGAGQWVPAELAADERAEWIEGFRSHWEPATPPAPNAADPFVLGFHAAQQHAEHSPDLSRGKDAAAQLAPSYLDGADLAAWLDGFAAATAPLPADPTERGRRAASMRWAIDPYTAPADGARWYWEPPGTPATVRSAWLEGWRTWWDTHPIHVHPGG